jgi:catechol 2,3-dioxygenase-like lactoylglutathione lyase family enzyme
MTVKRISHIAIVVPNIEEALDFYQDSLGLPLSHTERVSNPEDVIVAFMPAGDSEIELVEPVDRDWTFAFLGRKQQVVRRFSLPVWQPEATLCRESH